MRYCFDIDGTICSTNCHYEKAKPYKEVINKINSLYNSDEYIILYTSRGTGSGIDWKEFTKKQLKHWGVKYHELLLGKPQYDIFVDDRAINNEEWYKQNNIKVTE
tara:strand:- start:516 stop:830 length:315 start_codon:yes stop_codon:yes gene_type:complete